MNQFNHLYNDININIPDDRLSSLISSLNSDDHEDKNTLDKTNSVHSEILRREATKLDQLFKERPKSAEQDICFPVPSSSPFPIKHKQQETQFNKAALELFRSQQLEGEKVPISTSGKKLSLYGDNHTLTQLLEEDTPRFIYYHADTGRLQGKTLFDLCTGNKNTLTVEDLLNKENHWLDITSPTTTEMQAISRIFGIHPLTTEDIVNQEIREKCDSFRNYLFVCYRAFVHNDHLLKPTSFYNIVFKHHLLTIHFGNAPHVDYVQRRVEQLEAYITVVPDWINYAIIDEVTDSFAPLIHQIEHEVESLDDMVLHSTATDSSDQTEMVSRIGFCRKRVMQMLRLLSSKSDVIRALIKRFEERSLSSTTSSYSSSSVLSHGRILPDVGLYLGDVQDHIVTMLQNLNHFETLLARTHTNYLAKISIELTKSSNSTNLVIGRLTIFATILLPMNLVTGIWGMNVKVPGGDFDNLAYFFWIVCSLAGFAVFALTLARKWELF
ncbi:uncharacterized protein BX664DRAFT_265728 [Halteromyces radiatus]|uniref:uncharacterized protein n=1 Tax=Halteromyces radiatus TaxID=101107 RepID=UPI00221E50ED|nr:uncharacterized protein BX664DRAFT_265728 [Halteromyces radiatus]KAI8086309.1 hypothetical protein BX664DRAFT_265728 [Halteromyces radiatus]